MTVYIANIIEILFWFNARILQQSTNFVTSIAFTPLRLLTSYYTLAIDNINHVIDTFVIPAAQFALIPYHVVAAFLSLFNLMILRPLQTSFAPKVASNENGTRTAAVKRATTLSPQLNNFRCWQDKSAPMTSFQSRRPQLLINTQVAEAKLGMRNRYIVPTRIEPTPAPVPVSTSTSSHTDEGYESLSNHSADDIDIAMSFEPFDYEAAALAQKKRRSPKHKRLHPPKKLFTGRLPVGINAEQRDHLLSKALVAAC